MSNVTLKEDYIELHPLKKCVWVSREDRCRLCPEIEESFPDTIMSPAAEEKLLLRIDQMLGRRKNGSRVFLFRTSFNENKDRGLLEVEKFIIKMKKWFDAKVILEMLPTPDINFLDHAYGIGVDAVVLNLAVFNPDRFSELFPRKEAVIGYPHYWTYFEHAAKVFPRGAVFSQLMAGAEPLDDTRRGIAALTGVGVLPTLDLFGPPRAGFTQLTAGQKLELIRTTIDHAHANGFSSMLFRRQNDVLNRYADALPPEEEWPELDITLGNYVRNYRSCFTGRLKLSVFSKIRRSLRVEILQSGEIAI